MPVANLTTVDYVVMAIYFAVVLGIGWALRRMMRTSTDFFLSGRSLPPWVTGLAFLSANLGAQEVIGMGRSGAKYGSRPATSTGWARSRRWCSWGCS
jgi:SSS family solute:Na+ symporter